MDEETKGSRRRPPKEGAWSVDNSYTSPAKIDKAERIAKAIEPRKQPNMSYAKIGKEMGIHRSYAQKLVEAGIEQIIARSVEQLRELEGERLDNALAVVVDKLEEQADLAAVDRLIAISESRRKLFGLDAPDQHSTQLTVIQGGADPRTQADAVLDRIAETMQGNDGRDRSSIPAAPAAGNGGQPDR